MNFMKEYNKQRKWMISGGYQDFKSWEIDKDFVELKEKYLID